MGKYKQCPRCELNFILCEEDICHICKVELGKASDNSLIGDVDDENIFEDKVCPICKINYLSNDENICSTCKEKEEERKVIKNTDSEDDDSWEDLNDEPIVVGENDTNEIYLSDLAVEEDDFEDEEDGPTIIDDFDESFNDVDLNFDEDDEDDEDDDEDDEDNDDEDDF